MKPKYVILEYGVADNTTNPYNFDPYNLHDNYRGKILTSAQMQDIHIPMAIKSTQHMSIIAQVIRNELSLDNDIEIVSMQYQHAHKYFKENRDDIFVVSMSADEFFNYEWLFKYADDFYMCVSAGNKGNKGESVLSQHDEFFTSVGAINSKRQIQSYSSYGKGYVDVVGIVDQRINYTCQGIKASTITNGTSYACPFHGAHVANLMMAYYKKYGKKPNIKDIVKAVRNNCEDVLIKGNDIRSGHGLYMYIPNQIKLSDIKHHTIHNIKIDVNPDTPKWAHEAMEFMMANNITDGSRPNDSLTRAEMITMLYRFYNTFIKN